MKLLRGMAVLLMALAQSAFAQDGEVSLPVAGEAAGVSLPRAEAVRDAPLPFDDPAALPAIIKSQSVAVAPAKSAAPKTVRSGKAARAGKSVGKKRAAGKAASPKLAKTAQKPASAKATPKPAVTKRTGKKKAR